MDNARKIKLAMMTATSLLAASAALAPAHAGAIDPAAFPTTIEAPVVPNVAHAAADHGDHKASPLSKRLGLIGLAGGILAVLIKLVGAKKVMRAVKASAGQAARVATTAAVATASAAGRVLRSPLRYMAWTAGLILFALTGVSLFDIEWIGGLVVGAGLAGIAAYSLMKTRSVLRPVRVKSRASGNMENKN